MTQILRQSTAVVIPFGPFLDKTDGVALEVGAGIIISIDHATTGIFLSKNGAAGAIRHQNVTVSVLDAYGMFLVTLDTTDTNTLGRLRVMMAEAATFLPVWQDFTVIPATLWDTLFVAQPCAAINKLFDVVTPVLTCASVNQAGDAHVHADAIDTLTKASGPGDLTAIFGGVVTDAAGTNVGADTTEILTRLPDATAGAANGLAIIDATGVKLTKTVDLTSGQSIACSDKTGFSLAATGADLILKSSTFIQAIVAALNEFATYGLTALNTLLVTTGIKAATIPAATLAANQHVIVDSGTVTTLTNAPTDMALNSTVGKEGTLAIIAGYIDTEIGSIITELGKVPKSDSNVTWNATALGSITTSVPTAAAIGTDAASKILVTPAQKIVTDANGKVTYSNTAPPDAAAVNAACDTAISDAGIPAATAALVLVTPAQKIVTDANGKVSYSNTAPPTTAEIKTALEIDGAKLDHLWEMTEDDAGTRRLTANALEQAPSGGLDAAGIRTAVGLASANLDTQLAALPTDADITAAVPTVDNIHDEVVEGSLTFRQIIRIILAFAAGKSTGGGTTTVTFRDVADAKPRITATVDADGNRTAITRDGA